MVKNQVGLKIWCLRVLWYRIIPILHSVCFEIKHCFELHNNVQRTYDPNEPLTILVIIVHNIHKDFTFNSKVRNLMIIHFMTSDRRRTMSISTPKQTFSCTLCDEWSHYNYIAALISKICLLKTSLTLSKVITIDSIISSQHMTWKTVNQKRFALIL